MTQEISDTQTQVSDIFSFESQLMQSVIWGRLHQKNIKIKSLGTRIWHKILVNSSNTIDLCQAKYEVGRAESNDICLTLEEMPGKILERISKFHFQIERNLSDLSNPTYIMDISKRGTFINDELIGMNKIRILQNGDVISVSELKIKAFIFQDLSPCANEKLPKEISDRYYLSRQLGSGACATVRLVYNLRTCDEFAMKHIEKNLTIGGKNLLNHSERITSEVQIMESLDHPCIVKMHDFIDTTDSAYMILEYMKGGDLIDKINQNKRLPEKLAKLYFYQICQAVKYLHDKEITHRDLKPDNILLATKNDETLLKISDFGLSKFIRNDSIMRTRCGTPHYLAPEVLLTDGRGSYTKKVDIWSLGVVLFLCLSGTFPFQNSREIQIGEFYFEHSSWNQISSIAKCLIAEMLTFDPNQRPSIDYILSHEWLRDSEIIRIANNLMKIDYNLNENIEDKTVFFEVLAEMGGR